MDGEWMSGSLGGWMDDDGCMDVMNRNLSFFLVFVLCPGQLQQLV